MHTIRVFIKNQMYNGSMPKSLTDSLAVLSQIGQAFIALGSIEYELGNQTSTGNIAHIKHSINQQTTYFTKSGILDTKLHTMLKASQSVIILAEGYQHKYVLLGTGERSRILILPEEENESSFDKLICITQALWPSEELQCSGNCNWRLNDHKKTVSIMLSKDPDLWGTEKQKQATQTIIDQIPGSSLHNDMAIVPQAIIPNRPKPASISL